MREEGFQWTVTLFHELMSEWWYVCYLLYWKIRRKKIKIIFFRNDNFIKFCLYITLLLVQSYFDLISCVQQHCLFNFLKNIFFLWIDIDILHTKGYRGGGVFLNQRLDEFQCELSFSGEKSILSTLNLNNYTSLYKRLGKVKPCVGLTIPRRLFRHNETPFSS